MLMESIDTLIFDLDNTLIDRNAAMRQTIQDWLIEQGYVQPALQTALTDSMLYDNWGYADRLDFTAWLLHTYGKEQSKSTTAQALQQLVHVNNSRNVQPDPQVQALLKLLGSQFRLVLATNGGSTTQRAKINQAQLETFFEPDAIFVSGEMEFEKPDPRYFKKIISDLQLNVTRTLVIGDNLRNDIQAAQACGLYTCWVSHGRAGEAGIQPNMIIKNITETGTWSKQLI